MSKSFFAVDKLNVVAKECFALIKFDYNGLDYLIYYTDLDNNKCNLFVSKMIDNKLVNVLSDNNIVALVQKIVELPSSYSKSLDTNTLIDAFVKKYNISFSSHISSLGEQDACDDSPFVVADFDYIKYVDYFYTNALPKYNNFVLDNKKREEIEAQEKAMSSPIFSVAEGSTGSTLNGFAPTAGTLPISDTVNTNSAVGVLEEVKSDSPSSSSPSMEISSVNYNVPTMDLTLQNSNNFMTNNNVTPVASTMSNYNNIDNSMGVYYNNASTNYGAYQNNGTYYNNVPNNYYNNYNQVQPNNYLVNQNAGFASSKYIIIGTVCLILASAIVALSIIVVNRL